MSKHSDFIERFELKYLITEGQVAALRAEALLYCRPDRHNPRQEGAGYVVNSLYLDTPTLALHRAARRNDPDRFKLRIRTYTTDGDASLEIKRKVKETTHKRRARVRRSHIREAAFGLAAALGDGQQGNLEAFASLVSQTGAEPVALVRYEREAYESEVDDYARVTFDRRVRFQTVGDWELDGDPDAWAMVDGSPRYGGLRSQVILELKCQRKVPWWLSSIIQSFSLRLNSFSKYSRSLLTEHRRERGLRIQDYG